MTHPSVCLENVHLVPSARAAPVVCDAYVEDGVVAAIDEGRSSPQPADVRIDCSRSVAIPGLLNLHVHCRPQRALSDGLPVPVWHRRVDLLSRHMTEHDAYVGGLIAYGEMLLSGVTGSMVMTRYFNNAADAAGALGIRSIVVPLAGDGGGVERGDLDDLASSLRLIRDRHDRTGRRRQELWPGFDSPLTTSKDGMSKVAAAARELGVGIHTHMAETQYEVEAFRQKRGLSEPVALRDAGVLGDRTVLAHCNWLSDDDIDLLAETQTAVVHNPASNMRFASGICRVPELKEAGVKLALGTDGMLSGYELNMFTAMRATAMLHRISTKDANVLTSADVFAMTTESAAAMVGVGTGRLGVGAVADIAVLDMSGIHLQPYRRDPLNDQDLLNLIVWCARPSDVQHVLCDGELLVRDRALQRLDEREIRMQAIQADSRLRPLITP
jgi:5-methylthioadenosine/S-adenosylhomocysteine deaminase